MSSANPARSVLRGAIPALAAATLAVSSSAAQEQSCEGEARGEVVLRLVGDGSKVKQDDAGRSTSRSLVRRIVIENGNVVVDEAEVDGDKVDPREFDRLHRGAGAGAFRFHGVDADADCESGDECEAGAADGEHGTWSFELPGDDLPEGMHFFRGLRGAPGGWHRFSPGVHRGFAFDADEVHERVKQAMERFHADHGGKGAIFRWMGEASDDCESCDCKCHDDAPQRHRVFVPKSMHGFGVDADEIRERIRARVEGLPGVFDVDVEVEVDGAGGECQVETECEAEGQPMRGFRIQGPEGLRAILELEASDPFGALEGARVTGPVKFDKFDPEDLREQLRGRLEGLHGLEIDLDAFGVELDDAKKQFRTKMRKAGGAQGGETKGRRIIIIDGEKVVDEEWSGSDTKAKKPKRKIKKRRTIDL